MISLDEIQILPRDDAIIFIHFLVNTTRTRIREIFHLKGAGIQQSTK